jgi:hypothetical protein
MYMKPIKFSPLDLERMEARIIQILSMWVKLKTACIPRQLRKYVNIDEQKLIIAVQYYWMDLRRLKIRHNITERLHRAKVAAYMIKWVLHFSPANSSYPAIQVKDLAPEHALTLLELNQILAIEVMFYIADALDYNEFVQGRRFDRVLRDFRYYLSTAAYQEKMASVLIEALIVASSSSPGDIHENR